MNHHRCAIGIFWHFLGFEALPSPVREKHSRTGRKSALSPLGEEGVSATQSTLNVN